MKHLFLTLFVTSTLAPAAAMNSDLDPSRIGWSELQFRASVLFFSVDANIVLDELAAREISPALMEPGEGIGVTAEDVVQQLRFTTDFVGRHTTTDLWLNASSGAALQRTSHDSGNRFRHRIYRYTDIGAYHKTRWPVGKDEENLPADRWPEWSEAGEDLRPYPPQVAGAVITDPGGLLYIVSAAKLEKPGDQAETLAFVRGHVHRVSVEVLSPEIITVKYRERSGKDLLERKGKQEVMRLLIRGQSVDDGDAEDEFEMLGLRGDIIMHMDSQTRAPLQLTGRVKIAGRVTMRLTHLVVR